MFEAKAATDVIVRQSEFALDRDLKEIAYKGLSGGFPRFMWPA
jgi:hypothetical protein